MEGAEKSDVVTIKRLILFNIANFGGSKSEMIHDYNKEWCLIMFNNITSLEWDRYTYDV